MLSAVFAVVAASRPMAQRPVAQRPVAQRPAPAPSHPDASVPFRVGETLTYDVSWSSYLTAGTVTTTVKQKQPSYGSTAYYIVAEARPTVLLSKLYTLYYKLDTLMDSSTLLSQRGSIYSEEGKRHRFKVTQFDRGARKAFFEYQSTSTVKDNFPIQDATQDALSAVYALRAMPLKAGDRLTMPISDDGDLYQLHVDVAGRERVKSALGETSAWKLTASLATNKGETVGRPIALWISDDARHLPLRMQSELAVGAFNLTLREVR